MYTLPQLLPKRYTDDSIIPAIVIDVIPAGMKEGENSDDKTSKGKARKRRSSFISLLKGTGGVSDPKDGKIMKVVYMPRREYLKFFARGLKGEYIGTEPYRRWTEDELEESYGQYKPPPIKKGYRAPT